MSGPISPDEQRRVHRIFLASPGDLVDERQMVGALVGELNRVLAPHLDLILELYGWERQRPRAGRAQGVINPHVDACHLFIGLLAERWGSDTGEDTSGFHEEFERALERNQRTGAPEIMLAFRAVDAARARDAGPQLTQVLEFQQRMRQERVLLYQSFPSVDSLEEQLRDWLQAHLFEVAAARDAQRDARTAHEGAASASPAVVHSLRPEVSPSSGDGPPRTPNLLVSAAGAVRGLFDQRDFDAYAEAGMQLTAEQLLRLRLHVTAWAWWLHAGEPLGRHDQNSLYQIRERVTLLPPEDSLVLTALIGDADTVLPGWYWFRRYDADDTVAALVREASEGRDVAGRARAVRLLAAAGVRVGDDAFDAIRSQAAADDTAQIARALVEYARELGDATRLRGLEGADGFRDGVTEQERVAALLDALARTSLESAVEEAVRVYAAVPRECAEFIEAHAHAASPKALGAMLASRQRTELFELGLRIVIRRGAFTEPQLRGFLASDDSRTRETVLRALIAEGAALTPEEIRAALPEKPTSLLAAMSISKEGRVDADGVLLDYYRRQPEAVLRARIDFMSADSPIAYRALGLGHFGAVGEQIRSDLASDFTSLRPIDSGERAVSRGLSGLSVVAVSHLAARYQRQRHAEAALAVLAEHGGATDVPFATAFLLDTNYVHDPAPIIRLVARFGRADDAVALIAYAERAFGDGADAAARAAVALSPDSRGAIRALLASAKEGLVRIGIEALRGESVEELLEIGEPLLADSRDAVRLTATAVLTETVDDDALEALTARYREAPTYYYDVSCWLDRVLYAPPPLAEAFRRQLLARLSAYDAQLTALPATASEGAPPTE